MLNTTTRIKGVLGVESGYSITISYPTTPYWEYSEYTGVLQYSGGVVDYR
jgi:hypothetical protein